MGKKTFNVSMDEKMFADLKKVADLSSNSVASIIRIACGEYLDKASAEFEVDMEKLKDAAGIIAAFKPNNETIKLLNQVEKIVEKYKK